LNYLNGTPVASVDSLIAAVAQTYNLIVVTRNENDFASTNVTIVTAPLLNQRFRRGF